MHREKFMQLAKLITMGEYARRRGLLAQVVSRRLPGSVSPEPASNFRFARHPFPIRSTANLSTLKSIKHHAVYGTRVVQGKQQDFGIKVEGDLKKIRATGRV
jgi:hypothetical protein